MGSGWTSGGGGYAPGQADSPQRPVKMDVVRSMLRQARPGSDPDSFLTGREPHEVQFPNHCGSQTHGEFVTVEVLKAVGQGAVRGSGTGLISRWWLTVSAVSANGFC